MLRLGMGGGMVGLGLDGLTEERKSIRSKQHN